ncbi:unnamed protein product [Vitrella brassicaformis CCMP3155]|uniref:ATP receptor n=1 Tax=Vitrella brassicaformis (strain CCMP3155) TaxID=1169540 RepID=A0A0G4EPF9_VITBC|nr:unnamed protein product [Vitrella brassicaformis CCMP3155]|mmetsp:Transcript_30098/g.74751  ORF Transcript_30098/g.74751 Transcript_30098/m.74751 type:complete len:383 (-) Transcript_30098:148-1296(-)|eukprot:CEL99140.1 unnamed protein product [Vitrella brassicaformis CCMP3155]
MEVFNEDIDRLLSYHTKQQVSIIDRYLGLTNLTVQLLIVAYIAGYVFWYDEGYKEYEQAKGTTSTHVSGSVLAQSSGSLQWRAFSADEIAYPPLENGNVFIATKYEVQNQTRDVCEDMDRPCTTDADCASGQGTCTPQKLCKEPSWCPEGTNSRPEVFKLRVAESKIWIKSAVQFLQLQRRKVFKNSMSLPIMYPEEGYNTFTVRDLLNLCDPPVRYEEVSELGAAIEVQVNWRCMVEGPPTNCRPEYRARRLDTLLDNRNVGFTFAYPEYDLSDPDRRRLNKLTGIRFYIRTVGTGWKVSITAIIFKLSTGLALLGLAPILTDFLMLNCMKERRRYRARKYDVSQDFSDFFDQAAQQEVKREREDSEDEDEDVEEEVEEDD